MTIEFSLGQIIVWLIIGALVGTLVGRLIKDRRHGWGFLGNLFVGLVGAVIGGIIFDVLDIRIGGDIVITFSDLLSAFVGALIFLGLLRLLRR